MDLVGVVHGFGQDGDAAEHESLEFVAGEFGGPLAEADQFGCGSRRPQASGAG